MFAALIKNILGSSYRMNQKLCYVSPRIIALLVVLMLAAPIANAAEHQQTTLDDFSVVSKQTLSTITHSWNATEKDFDCSQTMLMMFQACVENNPNKIAVIAGNRSHTYEEINQQALKVATYLSHNGVKPGDMVAICIARSELLPVSMLAVFYCGACSVPVDPEYPEQRIRYMLDNAQVSLVLMESDVDDLFTSEFFH